MPVTQVGVISGATFASVLHACPGGTSALHIPGDAVSADAPSGDCVPHPTVASHRCRPHRDAVYPKQRAVERGARHSLYGDGRRRGNNVSAIVVASTPKRAPSARSTMTLRRPSGASTASPRARRQRVGHERVISGNPVHPRLSRSADRRRRARRRAAPELVAAQRVELAQAAGKPCRQDAQLGTCRGRAALVPPGAQREQRPVLAGQRVERLRCRRGGRSWGLRSRHVVSAGCPNGAPPPRRRYNGEARDACAATLRRWCCCHVDAGLAGGLRAAPRDSIATRVHCTQKPESGDGG